MSQVVTGDAVVLDLRIAKMPSRALAQLLDLLLQMTGLFLLAPVAGIFLATFDTAAGTAMMITMFVAVAVGYPVLLETLTRGYTLGKWALGLRAVRDDGGPIRFRHALARGLLEMVEVWTFPFVSVIASTMSRRGKRLGDLLAGTVVIRERAPVRPVGPVLMPPGYETWAAGLDLSGLSRRDALHGRQLLGRWRQMEVGARGTMARELAARVERSVQPPPPANTAPATYLAAVLAERHRRELERLHQQQMQQQQHAVPQPFGLQPHGGPYGPPAGGPGNYPAPPYGGY